MNSFATSTLRMLLCIVHLVKIFIQKNSLTSRTQLKRVTLFQRSTPSRPDHVLNEILISLNSRKKPIEDQAKLGAAKQNNVVAVYPGNKCKPEESRKVQRGIKIGM